MIYVNPYYGTKSTASFPFPNYGPYLPDPGSPPGSTTTDANGNPVHGTAVACNDERYSVFWNQPHPSLGGSGLTRSLRLIPDSEKNLTKEGFFYSITKGPVSCCNLPGFDWLTRYTKDDYGNPLSPGSYSTGQSTKFGCVAWDSTTNKGVCVGGAEFGTNNGDYTGNGFVFPLCSQITTDLPYVCGNIPPAAPGTTINLPWNQNDQSPLYNPRHFMIVADNFDHPTSTTLTCYAATDTDTTWRKIVTTPLQPWMTKITHFGMFINDWGAPTNPATILLFADYGGNIIGDKIYGTMPPLLIPS